MGMKRYNISVTISEIDEDDEEIGDDQYLDCTITTDSGDPRGEVIKALETNGKIEDWCSSN